MIWAIINILQCIFLVVLLRLLIKAGREITRNEERIRTRTFNDNHLWLCSEVGGVQNKITMLCKHLKIKIVSKYPPLEIEEEKK